MGVLARRRRRRGIRAVRSTPSTLDVDELIAEDELSGLDDPDVRPQDTGPFLKDS